MDEDQRIKVQNVMEDVVGEIIDNIIEITGMCGCPKCRADVMALSLNKLPPKYVATQTGNVFSHMEATATQMQAEITVAVMTAVEMVTRNPKH